MSSRALVKGANDGLPGWCRAACSGSSWGALQVAISTKPSDLAELLRIIGAPKEAGKYRTLAFDAACDGWDVYQDALNHSERFS